jgi:Deoxynucleoside kinase
MLFDHMSMEACQELSCPELAHASLRFLCVLQSDVGIRVKRHCNMIAQHLLHLQQDADAEKPLQQPLQQEKKLTLCVEGNISAGKSTFLRMLTHELTLHELVEVSRPVCYIRLSHPDFVAAVIHDLRACCFTDVLLWCRWCQSLWISGRT